MEKELLYKNRSFSSCINAAYKLQIENLRNIIRCTWLPILVQSILLGCYTVLLTPWLTDSISFANKPFTHLAAIVGIAIIQMVLFSWILSRMMSLLNEKPRRWNFKRSLWVMLANAIISIAFISIISGAAGVAIGYLRAKANTGEGATPSPTALFIIMAIYLVLILLYICLIQLPLLYTSMKYLNDEKMHLWKDMLACHRIGMRHWGFIFITVFLSSIFVTIITMLLSTPSYILGFAHYASEMGIVTGDPSGMPAYFPWLQFITVVIVSFLVYQVLIFELLVIYFMYGSIETQEEERKSAHHIPPIPTDVSVEPKMNEKITFTTPL